MTETPFDAATYERLRQRASGLLRVRGKPTDPSTVSLVNAALLGCLKQERDSRLPDFETDAHVIQYVTRSMRNHLVTLARRSGASRRPPEARRAPWPETDAFPATTRPPAEIVAVHEALNDLRDHKERLASVVELIFFGGCSYRDVAEVLGISVDAVGSDWRYARAWLGKRLSNGSDWDLPS